MIVALLLTVIGALGLLFWRESTYSHPIIDLKIFKNFNFSIGCILSFLVGIGLYGTIYLLPMLLSIVKNYDSLRIGSIMFVAGFCQFFSGPLANILSHKIDIRYCLGIGIIGLGISTMMCGFLTIEFDFHDLLWPQVIKGFVLIFCFLPLTSISMGSIPIHELKNASSLLNLTRNLGGAIGIALIETNLSSNIRNCSLRVRESLTIEHIQKILSPYYTSDFLFNHTSDGNIMTKIQYKLMESRIMSQAFILAFNNIFIGVGIAILIGSVLIYFLKPTKKSIKNEEMSMQAH
jgi:DHA2 family multidrug resistance protein